MTKENAVILFHQKTVRRHWDETKELWYFSVVDVVEILTDTKRPRKYWSDLKKRLVDEGSEVSDKIGQLKMLAPDGKKRQTDVIDTENLLRLIQSIPSPKAEPFKLWLAKVGYERIEETEDPESFDENRTVARQGGHVAGTARKEIEAQTGESIVSSDNAAALRLGNQKDDLHIKKEIYIEQD